MHNQMINLDKTIQGIIIKGMGGNYQVAINKNCVYNCNAKGVFRYQKIKPTIGDRVVIEVIDQENFLGNIIKIESRTNILIRPAVSNVDQGMIIFALAQPTPNLNLLDRFLVQMQMQNLKTMIVFSKSDLVEESTIQEMCRHYEKTGYETMVISVENKIGIDDLIKKIKGKTTVLAGPSGVGKSSLINAISPNIQAQTGELSEKIKRGKHTTRHNELMFIDTDTYLVDTPGFSSLIIDGIECNDLREYYPEFDAFREECHFSGCVHINEKDCGIKNALAKNNISSVRYNNYKLLYEELKKNQQY